jgi:hypothetical protein
MIRALCKSGALATKCAAGVVLRRGTAALTSSDLTANFDILPIDIAGGLAVARTWESPPACQESLSLALRRRPNAGKVCSRAPFGVARRRGSRSAFCSLMTRYDIPAISIATIQCVTPYGADTTR